VPKVDVGKWLARGDLFLNTTHVDNTPISVLEAMASGLCVISTRVGGIPYLLSHGQDALLVSPDDPRAMAEAVERILTEPLLARHLSRSARARAETFDRSVVLPQWRSLMDHIASGVHLRMSAGF
jgi:glycosyltransferase involved in cell wall biosynthesis